jgi:hypothetical protein
MDRRELLSWGASVASAAVLGIHPTVAAAYSPGDQARFWQADLEPDGMWAIYRRYNLLIVGQRDDEEGSAIARAVVDALVRFLPNSRAKFVRAVDTRRIGVLIGTEQQDVAIMAAESAEALFLAKPPFDDIRNVPLRLLISFGSHVLVCRRDFAARHAYLLTKSLAENSAMLPRAAGWPEGIVPAHRGAEAFFAGEEMPDA